MTEFPKDAIPPEGFEIDEPTFKATKRTLTMHGGRLNYLRTCYELIGGRWEGFTSLSAFGGKGPSREAKPSPKRAPAAAR